MNLLLWQCGESVFEDSHEFHSQSLSATQEAFPGLHEGHGCVGSFTGIYGSQALLCGREGTRATAQLCQVVISLLPPPWKQLPWHQSSFCREVVVALRTPACAAPRCPGSARAKLLTSLAQSWQYSSKPQCRSSQFRHIMGYSLSNLVSWAVLLGGGSFSRHSCLWVTFSTPACPAARAVGELVGFLQPAISQDRMHHFDLQWHREDSLKQHHWQMRGQLYLGGGDKWLGRWPAINFSTHAALQSTHLFSALGTELEQCWSLRQASCTSTEQLECK